MPLYERAWYEPIDLKNWLIFLGDLVARADDSTVPKMPINTLHWLLDDPVRTSRVLGPVFSDMPISHRLKKYLEKQVRVFSETARTYLVANGYEIFSVPARFNLAHWMPYWNPLQIEEDELLYELWRESALEAELAWKPVGPFVPGGRQIYKDSIRNLKTWSNEQGHERFNIRAIVPSATIAGWLFGNPETVDRLFQQHPGQSMFETWTSTEYKGKRLLVDCGRISGITGGPIMGIMPHDEDMKSVFLNSGMLKILRPGPVGEGVV